MFYTILIMIAHLHFCNSKMTDIHTSSHSLQKLLRSEIEFKNHLYEFMSNHNNTSIAVKDVIEQSYSNYSTGLNLNVSIDEFGAEALDTQSRTGTPS